MGKDKPAPKTPVVAEADVSFPPKVWEILWNCWKKIKAAFEAAGKSTVSRVKTKALRMPQANFWEKENVSKVECRKQ